MTNASAAQGREPSDTSALRRAAEEGDASAVKSLLDAGAAVDARAEAGETALMRAASKGHLEVVRLLLEAGADVHARSENGFTALFMAVFFGHAAVVRALLEAGSDPAAPMQLNLSPEKWAALWGDAEIAGLLQDARDAHAGESAGGEHADEQSSFFPAEGEFRPVVPLSEIGETDAAEEGNAHATHETLSPAGEAGEDSHASTPATDDGPEEKTLVRSRVRSVPAPRSLPPTGARRSWPALALALVLSVTAGLLVGTYLIWPRRTAEAPPIASTAEDASKAERANQAEATAQASNASPANAPVLPAEPQPATVSDRPGDGEQTKAATAGAGHEASDVKPAQTIKATAGRGEDAEEPLTRRVTNAVARRERPARSDENVKDYSAAARPARDSAREREARAASALSSNPVRPERSLPISSPPPSAKSRNVIKWP